MNNFYIVFGKNIEDNIQYNEFSTSLTRIPSDQSINDIEKTNTNRVLTFRLNDQKLTNIFVDTWIKNKTPSERCIHWNIYKKVDEKYRVYLQKTLNSSIDNFNNTIKKLIKYINCNYIDNELKLNISKTDIQKEKLNDIHYFFESELARKDIPSSLFESNQIPRGLSGPPKNFESMKEFFLLVHTRNNLLESFNNIVHLLESENTKVNQIFTVIRNVQVLPKDNYHVLQDEDYASFQSVNHTVDHQGILYLDYATVGKDLFAAYCTNDIDLVKNNEIKPQIYCKPYVNFAFTNKINRLAGKVYDEYEEYILWCKKNNIKKYIDYTLPIHTPGRAILGVTSDIKTIEDYIKLLTEYPYIIGAYVE